MWRPEVQCFDRVAHSDVAVDAHGGEREDRCEHVVVVDGHHYLAQHVPKRPCPHQVVDTLEGQRAGDQGIGQSEVEDVDVGGCLHFSVSAQKAWIHYKKISLCAHLLKMSSIIYSHFASLCRFFCCVSLCPFFCVF